MPEIISRADAERAGLKRFFTGKPCKQGHVSERYTSNKQCIECCHKEGEFTYYARKSPEQKAATLRAATLRRQERKKYGVRVKAKNARDLAREAGNKTYFTGPCKYGHFSHRNMANGQCIECKRIQRETPEWKAKAREQWQKRSASQEGKLWRAKYSADPSKKMLRAASTHLKSYGEPYHNKMARFEEQGKRCAICETDVPSGKGWCQDHDHRTGKMRGVLCTKCNMAIGLANDSISILKSMIAYLKRHESQWVRVGKILFSEEELEKILPSKGRRDQPHMRA